MKKTLLLLGFCFVAGSVYLLQDKPTTPETQQHAEPSNKGIEISKTDQTILSSTKTEPISQAISIGTLPHSKNQQLSENGQLTNNSVAAELDAALTMDNPSLVPAETIAKAEAMCQQPKQALSNLACRVLQHRNDLVQQKDDQNNPMESDWQAIARNGGGVEGDELVEVSAIQDNQSISQDAGGVTDTMSNDLENLANRTLYDHSAQVRLEAVQEAINTKSEAIVPLLQQALNDDDAQIRELAEAGLNQLQNIELSHLDGNQISQVLPPQSSVQGVSIADRMQ